jgi:hypothetical protein
VFATNSFLVSFSFHWDEGIKTWYGRGRWAWITLFFTGRIGGGAFTDMDRDWDQDLDRSSRTGDYVGEEGMGELMPAIASSFVSCMLSLTDLIRFSVHGGWGCKTNRSGSRRDFGEVIGEGGMRELKQYQVNFFVLPFTDGVFL